MARLPVPARLAAVAAALALAACTDQNPVAPTPKPLPTLLRTLECTVQVRAQTMECRDVAPVSGARFEIIGNQDVYVRLRSSGTSYDGGTQILQTNVTVENLIGVAMGTDDGVVTTGVNVFFHSGPNVTGGSGNASVSNADGTGTFTGSNQPYFLYNQILAPFQLSNSKNWQFAIDNTVTTFSFQVYVAADLNAGAVPLSQLASYWEGDVDGDFGTAGNWSTNAVPDSTSAVSVLSDSLFAGTMPTLAAAFDIGSLRVGFGSTLSQGGFGLTVRGNVDATGTVSGGEIHMSGTGVYVNGNVASLRVTGSTSLQGATRATGAVSVSSGSLTVKDQALTISIP